MERAVDLFSFQILLVRNGRKKWMASAMLLTWLSIFAMNLMITLTSVWQVNGFYCRVCGRV